MAHYDNVLATKAASGQLCKALGIRLVTNPQVVQIAKNAGFDALFIDLEHSTLSVADASAIAGAGLLSGLTPFVRLPYQCGMGYVQLWGQQPVLGLQARPLHYIAKVCNKAASSVLLMIEGADGIKNIDEIAAVDDVDVLLVGCIDLSTDMGVPGGLETKAFREALEAVSAACQRHKRTMGLAGAYDNREFQDWAINTLQVRFILCQQDSNVLAAGAMECAAAVVSIDKTVLPN